MVAVALDSGVITGALDAQDPWHEAAAAFVRPLRKSEALVCAVAYAECLVRPHALGMAGRVEEVLAPTISVVPVDAAVASLAALIRSEDKIAMPDALIIASAMLSGAHLLATTDRAVAATTRIATVDLTRA